MKLSRLLLCTLTLLAGGVAGAAAQAAPGAAAPKLYHGACPPFSRNLRFECYHTHAEVTAFLQEAARQYPQWTRLESIGKSYGGRDLWVITITDFSTGDHRQKPGVWVDGGLDSDEVVAIEAALGLVHRLLTSNDPQVAELRRTRTFYILPAANPDASDMHLTTAVWMRDTSLRPWDDDGDGIPDNDFPQDLDGDGQALRMRQEHPLGEWVKDERDGRLMRRRRPGDARPFYKLHPEGLDSNGDGEIASDPPGGIDPNRNYPGNWYHAQSGAGPFPASESEIRAQLDFLLAHPNIAASQHLHSTGGVILRPPSVPDLRLPERDYLLYMELGRRGLEVTGYDLATSVYDWNWPRGAANTRRGQIWRTREGRLRGWPEEVGGGNFYGVKPRTAEATLDTDYPAYGGSIDSNYLLFGVLAFANEIYRLGEDLDGDGRVDEYEQLMYDDRTLRGEAFKNWTPFDHPQLGRVEIGGWRKFGRNNPLPRLLGEEVRRNVDFVLMQAEHTPLLRIPAVEVEALEGSVYRIKATVRNAGLQPTELAIREERNRAEPVRVTLTTDTGVTLLSSEARHELGTLAGYAEKSAEWLVRAPDGGSVTVTAAHPKGGTTSAAAALSATPASGVRPAN